MTDIIERLEAACQKGREDIEPWQCDPFLFGEAAAEIKRLKADMAGDQQRLFYCEADNARLRDELSYCPRDMQVADGMIRDLRADNARLRAAIKERKEFCEMLCGRGWQVAELLESKP